MSRHAIGVLFCLLVVTAARARATEETSSFGPFGTVYLYSSTPAPAHVVLFVSGDGGWNQGVVDMARELARESALVVGIDIVHYLRALNASQERCVYPAEDFELLSRFIQKSRGFASYRKPVLVGYSSGATLVYALIAEAPATTFRGAISLGFCPDLTITKEMCKEAGLDWQTAPHGKGVTFLPAKHLPVPWVALQGEIDQVCLPEATRRFVSQMPDARIVMLPRVGHGYSVPRNWLPQFQQAFTSLVTSPDSTEPPRARVDSLADLPLHEVRAKTNRGSTLVVHLTGDGGYGVTDKGIAEGLAAQGVSTVVLNSLHYFWKPRTPEQSSADVARVIRHYLAAWHDNDVVLVGYSFGADVLPFVISRFPADLRDKVRALVLIGAGNDADFEVDATSWLHGKQESHPVLPELEPLRGLHITSFYGTRDKEALSPASTSGFVESIPIDGGHRVGSNYDVIVRKILEESAPR